LGVSRVSIVLVTWNSALYLPRCLAGIAALDWPDVELIVVDNASTDASLDLIPVTAVRIANDENRGFAAAVNQGIAASTGDYVLLLNPDAWIAPDFVTRLVQALEEAGDPFGAAGGTLWRGEGPEIRKTDEIDSLGIRMTRSGRHLDITGPPRHRERREGSQLTARGREIPRSARDDGGEGEQRPATSDQRTTNNEQRTTEVFGLTGAAVLYRRTFIRDVSVGGEFLDEDFFAYREDADVAWRGQLFGWRALYVPAAEGVHVRRVTPERRRSLPAEINRHSVKNRFLLRLKNEGLYLALRNAPFELARDLVVLGAALTVERSSLPAFGWLWKNRGRIMAKRREIQRRRRVSDRALAKWFR
jgi:GT2 family glycosyltransferase